MRALNGNRNEEYSQHDDRPDCRHVDAHPQREPHRAPAVDMPATKLKATIAQVLKDEGFILDYPGRQAGARTRTAESPFQTEVSEHGSEEGPARLPEVRPRRRARHPPHPRAQQAGPPALSAATRTLKPILEGLGISVLSTSRGVMSDRKARAERWAANCCATCGESETEIETETRSISMDSWSRIVDIGRIGVVMSRIGKQPVAIPAGVKVEAGATARSASRAPRASSNSPAPAT